MPPVACLVIHPEGMPRFSSSSMMKSARDVLRVSLIAGVPVLLSAAPVTVMERPYFFAMRASSSRLTSCEVSVRSVVPSSKKK